MLVQFLPSAILYFTTHISVVEIQDLPLTGPDVILSVIMGLAHFVAGSGTRLDDGCKWYLACLLVHLHSPLVLPENKTYSALRDR